jgi:uncharacterized lipoprotein NlpE involved in copper resistance
MKKIITIILLISLLLIGCQSQPAEEDQSKKILYPESTVSIKDLEGNEIEITLEEIVDLGEVEFEATKDTSSSGPEENSYTGILLKDLFNELEISTEDFAGIVVSAEDGYKVTIEADKVSQDDNVFLTYKKEGEWLENKDNDGDGPIQLIISKDQFSQYWCKYVTSIELIE